MGKRWRAPAQMSRSGEPFNERQICHPELAKDNKKKRNHSAQFMKHSHIAFPHSVRREPHGLLAQ
jgi:hypothetical protein